MLVGQRGAGVVTPLVVGVLANSSTFGVGQAMAIVVLPSILAMFLTTLARR